jgi:hypothetical protein
LDELKGKRSDKKGEVWCVSRISILLNWLNLNLSLAGLSWPLYIGGQVSRIRSGSIQIKMSVYDIFSYFNYIYAWAYLAGPRGTKIMGLNSYTLVSSPRDSTKIIDSGWISNLHIFDLINLRLLLCLCFYRTICIIILLRWILVNKPGASDGF